MTFKEAQSRIVSDRKNYDYVSFSRLNFSHTLDDLINSAANWTSIQCELLEDFNYQDFRKSLSAANPIPAELIDVAEAFLHERILFVLAHDRYRAGTRSYVDDAKDAFLEKIQGAIRENRPVEIILPSFPGREVNPIARTRPQLHLGELAAICRLAEIASVVQAIYAPGLRFIIVGDGIAYAPFYGDPVGAAVEYKRELVDSIEKLGASEFVTVDDLADIIAERQDEFEQLHREVEVEIKDAWSETEYDFRDELAYTMRMGTQSAAINAAAVQLVKFPQADLNDLDVLERLRISVRTASEKTAFAYQCLLVTLRRMELLDRKFPTAIRGTVHAKTGQYSPHLVNEFTTISPWHGVALQRRDGRVDIVYEAEVLANPRSFVAVYLKGDVVPFFYKEKP